MHAIRVPLRFARVLEAILLVQLILAAPASLRAASSGQDGVLATGTYRGRILSELFRHRQELARRARQQSAALSPGQLSPAQSDVGNIAIIDGSAGVVVRPNLFDLNGTSLAFFRSQALYTAARSPLGFDQQAQAAGIPINLDDDDARAVLLPFSFPFYGKSYTEAFVHSDGNLTFVEPDSSSSGRNLFRAISGPPRIAPLFTDLDPSREGATVSNFVGLDRFVITWNEVPEFRPFGLGRRQTFQVALHQDGRIEFHYQSVTLNDAVVGIMPGGLLGEPTAADLSEGISEPVSGALAEIFSAIIDLDIFALAQKFYKNHDDAYDFLVLFNNMGLQAGPGQFAFEVNVRNEVLGIGDLVLGNPVLDFGSEFGSPRRLQSFLNMGPLSNYPDDPTVKIPNLGENNTLSVLGQEAGHRFLAYTRFLDPATGLASFGLLGRDRAHWSFFFNSDASVVEGNRIEDQGAGVSPRFRTTAAVLQYSALDQYIMGLRGPEEVPLTFLVENPLNFLPSPRVSGSPPSVGVSFDGQRKDITVDMIIAAEGPRVPQASVAQKDFNFALILLIDEGSEPSAAAVAKLERIRSEWEAFFNQAVGLRGGAHTALGKLLHLSTWPAAGVVFGTPGVATVEIASPQDTDLEVLLSVDNGFLSVPSVVTIPAGELTASFPLVGNGIGLARLSARTSEPGYDTARTLVEVRASLSGLILEVEAGNDQVGPAGGLLPSPVTFRVRDTNRLPISGVPLEVSASGDGVAIPTQASTDALGRVEVEWRLATGGSLNNLTVVVVGAPSVRATAVAGAVGFPPAFSAAGVVNAASFNSGSPAGNVAIAPGSLLSIFGTALGVETAAADAFPLPNELGSATVSINGVPVPLLFVSPEQVNLHVPFELTGPTAQIVIRTPGGSSDAVSVPVGTLQPGIFFDPASGLGAILNNADGTPIWQRPARAGDFVEVFCTGLGAVEPPGRTGVPAAPSPLAVTVHSPQVSIGGRESLVTFSGLAPFFAGLYQINAQVPAGLPPGRHSLVLLVDGLNSNEVFIDVQ